MLLFEIIYYIILLSKHFSPSTRHDTTRPMPTSDCRAKKNRRIKYSLFSHKKYSLGSYRDEIQAPLHSWHPKSSETIVFVLCPHCLSGPQLHATSGMSQFQSNSVIVTLTPYTVELIEIDLKYSQTDVYKLCARQRAMRRQTTRSKFSTLPSPLPGDHWCSKHTHVKI